MQALVKGGDNWNVVNDVAVLSRQDPSNLIPLPEGEVQDATVLRLLADWKLKDKHDLIRQAADGLFFHAGSVLAGFISCSPYRVDNVSVDDAARQLAWLTELVDAGELSDWWGKVGYHLTVEGADCYLDSSYKFDDDRAEDVIALAALGAGLLYEHGRRHSWREQDNLVHVSLGDLHFPLFTYSPRQAKAKLAAMTRALRKAKDPNYKHRASGLVIAEVAQFSRELIGRVGIASTDWSKDDLNGTMRELRKRLEEYYAVYGARSVQYRCLPGWKHMIASYRSNVKASESRWSTVDRYYAREFIDWLRVEAKAKPPKKDKGRRYFPNGFLLHTKKKEPTDE